MTKVNIGQTFTKILPLPLKTCQSTWEHSYFIVAKKRKEGWEGKMQPSRKATTTQVYSMCGARSRRSNITLYLFSISCGNTVEQLIFSLLISSAVFPVHCAQCLYRKRSAPHCYLQQHGLKRAQTSNSCPCLQMQLYSSTEEK